MDEVTKKKNRYSVLMSVYKNDDPNHLKIALESIYENQTIKPDEIIVVFDGLLTSELYSVLEIYRRGKENVVKYFPQEVNRGLGNALKIGTDYCTGDYIFRMDADDISAEDRFEKQIYFIENNPNIDVLGASISEFNFSLAENMKLRICPAIHNDIIKMCKRRNPMNHVSVCIKKQALLECGGYEELKYLEDYLLWIKMISRGYTLHNLEDPLVYVRIGNGFEIKRSSKERINGWKTLQVYMLENGIITRRDSILNMIYIRIFVNTPAWIKKHLYKFLLRK